MKPESAHELGHYLGWALRARKPSSEGGFVNDATGKNEARCASNAR